MIAKFLWQQPHYKTTPAIVTWILNVREMSNIMELGAWEN